MNSFQSGNSSLESARVDEGGHSGRRRLRTPAARRRSPPATLEGRGVVLDTSAGESDARCDHRPLQRSVPAGQPLVRGPRCAGFTGMAGARFVCGPRWTASAWARRIPAAAKRTYRFTAASPAASATSSRSRSAQQQRIRGGRTASARIQRLADRQQAGHSATAAAAHFKLPRPGRSHDGTGVDVLDPGRPRLRQRRSRVRHGRRLQLQRLPLVRRPVADDQRDQGRSAGSVTSRTSAATPMTLLSATRVQQRRR